MLSKPTSPRSPARSPAIPAALAWLILSPIGGLAAQVAAYHDQTAAQHQAQFDSLSRQGYRPISLSMYDNPTSARYAAVWVRRGGPAFVGFHGVTAAGYQTLFSTWTAQGYAPRLLAATGAGTSIRFAGVFEQDATPTWAVHDVSAATFDTNCHNARLQGFILTAACVYGSAAAPLFAGVWQRNDRNVQWGYGHSANATEYQLHFGAWTQGWLRPTWVTLSSYGRYLSIWHDNQIQGGWIAGHDMTSSSYQQVVQAQANAGNYPICAQAGGSGAATRFAAVFAPSEAVVPRTFTATGVSVAGLAAFDDYVRNMMVAGNVRAGSLAVVKDGRLMLARGYTWAEATYPVTQPTSLFRIASSSKALTGVAMHRAMERSLGTVHDGRTMLSFFRPITPIDARTNNIRLVDLLTHRGGWHSGRPPRIDPVFLDVPVATYHASALPVSKDEIYRYMTLAQPLQFTPGAEEAYSNYGFMMLGEVLEAINGTSYEAVVKRDVFTPLGVVRPKIGGSTFAQIGTDEVRYHPRNPYIWRSVAHAVQPWVPGAYGDWNHRNLDAAGGWVLATCDYAKVLAALSRGDDCPILGGPWLDHMWSANVASAPDTLRGWWRYPVTSQGRTKYVRNHNGGVPGTAAMIALRDDGFGFCLFLNSDRGLGGVEIGALSLIADQVAQWPNHDLFPGVGIPSLRTRLIGTFTPFGAACSGTAGAPGLSGRGSPETGQVATYAVGGAPVNAPLLWLIGFSRTQWNSLSLPLSLAPWGASGCSLLVAPQVVIVGQASAAGIGSLDLPLPDNVSLIDLHVFAQVAPLDLPANAMGLVYSRGIDTRIGGWR